MTLPSRYSSALKEIDEGRKGLNAGLDMGFSRFVEYVPGLQKRTLYVVGGETGSGKSAFGLNSFVYSPYDHWKSGTSDVTDFKVFYWTLEMHPSVVITKAICRRIYLDHGILVDVNYVLSRGKNRINDEVYRLVLSYAKYFEELEDKITFIEGGNPTGVYNTLEKYMASIGTVHKVPTLIKRADGSESTVPLFHSYTPHGNIQVVGVVDHVALMKREREFNKKANIDKMSDYAIELRNRYGLSIAFIQQLNRDMSTADRFKQGRVEPQLSDFKETSDTTDAADVVLALFSPKRYEMEQHRGFDIRRLGDRYRYLKLLKSRDGAADMGIGVEYVGEIGLFRELPKSDTIDEATYQRVMLTKKSF